MAQESSHCYKLDTSFFFLKWMEELGLHTDTSFAGVSENFRESDGGTPSTRPNSVRVHASNLISFLVFFVLFMCNCVCIIVGSSLKMHRV